MEYGERKQKWYKKITRLVEEGGRHLGLPDRKIVIGEVNRFFDDFVRTQGRSPICDFSTISLLNNYLSPYGFSMERVEKWTREEKSRLSRRGIDVSNPKLDQKLR